MQKRIILITICLLAISKTLFAEPLISNVSGNFRHGGAIIISGDHFGSKDPAAPLLWDDGSSNPPLNTKYDAWLPDNAQQGPQYNMAYREVPFRGISAPNSRMRYILGGAHAISNTGNTYNGGGNVAIGKNISSHSYFISYYYRVDPNFDEENNSSSSDNMKELVLTNTEGSFYPDGWGAFGYSAWCNGSVPDVNYNGPVALQRMPIDPSNQDLPYACSGNNRVYHNNPIAGWIKMQWEGSYNQLFDSPQFFLTTYPDGQRTSQSHYGDGITVYEYYRGPWMGFPKLNDLRFIGIGGFARIPRMNNGTNSFRYFASIYIDKTHSRVMLGDVQEYSECTIMEPQIPSSWNNHSITVRTNLGSLPDEGTAYLFVFDSDNNHNAVGYAIDIGAGGSADQYPTIDIMSPVTGSSYSTSQNTVDMSGQASDDNGIVSVSWSNNRGGSGNATNASGDWSSWSVPGIALQEGENQITVTVTDSASQSTTDSLTVTLSASGTTAKAYDANNMTGDSTWENSYVTYCVRLLIPGSQISQSGNSIQLGFEGRNSGDYTIQRVSIAERDPNGSNGDIIDSTFTKITFDKKGEIYHENLAADSWENYDVVVPENTEKVSNTIQFNIDPGKDYYVTFSIQSPSVYLEPPSGYEELYIQGADNALHLDWSGIAYRVVRDYHALSSIYISNQPANPKGAR